MCADLKCCYELDNELYISIDYTRLIRYIRLNHDTLTYTLCVDLSFNSYENINYCIYILDSFITFNIIVGPYNLSVNGPLVYGPSRGFYPIILNVVHECSEGRDIGTLLS